MSKPTYKLAECHDTKERRATCTFSRGQRCSRRWMPGRSKTIPCDCWHKRPDHLFRPGDQSD